MFSLSGTDFGTACISGATGLHLAIAYGNDELADILVSTRQYKDSYTILVQRDPNLLSNPYNLLDST